MTRIEERKTKNEKRKTLLAWLLFLFQVGIVEMFDAADDIIRGDLFPPAVDDAVYNALRLVQFESSRGFFVEPDLYRWAQHSHSFLGLTLSSSAITEIANNVYAFLHIGVPVVVAGWVYLRHREHFGLLRNVLIVTSLVALLGYFLFPVAPPRLTTGIIWNGHPFHFHNTMPYPKSGTLINGHPLGYNPYAAMPSLHIAWATIVSSTLFLLSRKLALRIFAVCYPFLMTLAIVMTANHYIMDAVGGVLTVCVAAPIAICIPLALRRL